MAKGFAQKTPAPIKRGGGLLMKWSYSTWSDYEKCPAKARFKQIDRIAERGDRSALERGIFIHTVLEDIVKGAPVGKLEDAPPGKPTKLPTWKHEIQTLLDEKATAETEFALTQAWVPTAWSAPDVWLRGKLDASYATTIIDYKTGRAYPEHGYQADLYATAAFAGNPEADDLRVEFWYVDMPADKPEAKKTWLFKRDTQKSRIDGWEFRIEAMMNDTIFPVRPGIHCRWCGFAKSKGGPCEQG